MTTCRLIVQTVSYHHIQNVVHAMHSALKDNMDANTQLSLCDRIDDVHHAPGSIVFVIGENFAPHTRRPGCLYVHVNFSVVTVLGNPLKTSRIGWAGIRRKRRMLFEKIDHFDAVIDYFPPQTRRLQRRLSLPVFGFPVTSAAQHLRTPVSLEERPYDICFVGNMSPRRQAIIDELTAMGFKFSPSTGVVFEEVAAQSRCCLNIHAYRSNHLESPRIIGALAVGTPVITEDSYGLETLVPKDHCVCAPSALLVNVTQRVLGDNQRLAELEARATRWFDTKHLPSCAQQWQALWRALQELRTQKRDAAFRATLPRWHTESS